MTGRIAVIGAGVIGLSVAHELATAGHYVTVIAAYGHGGAGVTLSWGTAERILALVNELN